MPGFSVSLVDKTLHWIDKSELASRVYPYVDYAREKGVPVDKTIEVFSTHSRPILAKVDARVESALTAVQHTKEAATVKVQQRKEDMARLASKMQQRREEFQQLPPMVRQEVEKLGPKLEKLHPKDLSRRCRHLAEVLLLEGGMLAMNNTEKLVDYFLPGEQAPQGTNLKARALQLPYTLKERVERRLEPAAATLHLDQHVARVTTATGKVVDFLLPAESEESSAQSAETLMLILLTAKARALRKVRGAQQSQVQKLKALQLELLESKLAADTQQLLVRLMENTETLVDRYFPGESADGRPEELGARLALLMITIKVRAGQRVEDVPQLQDFKTKMTEMAMLRKLQATLSLKAVAMTLKDQRSKIESYVVFLGPEGRAATWQQFERVEAYVRAAYENHVLHNQLFERINFKVSAAASQVQEHKELCWSKYEVQVAQLPSLVAATVTYLPLPRSWTKRFTRKVSFTQETPVSFD